jgi:hypothetical protein
MSTITIPQPDVTSEEVADALVRVSGVVGSANALGTMVSPAAAGLYRVLPVTVQRASTTISAGCGFCGQCGTPCDHCGVPCGQHASPWKLGVSSRLEATFAPPRIQN